MDRPPLDQQPSLKDNFLRTSTPNEPMPPPTSGHDQQQQCCLQTRCENQLLRRALRKEREKRQFIGKAYQELLRSYETLLDLKNALDIPSPSISLSSGDEQPINLDQYLLHRPPVNSPANNLEQYFPFPPPRPAISCQDLPAIPPARPAPDRPNHPPPFHAQNYARPPPPSNGNIIHGSQQQQVRPVIVQPAQVARRQSTTSTAKTRTLSGPSLALGEGQPNGVGHGNAEGAFGRTFVLPQSNTRYRDLEQRNAERMRAKKANRAGRTALPPPVRPAPPRPAVSKDPSSVSFLVGRRLPLRDLNVPAQARGERKEKPRVVVEKRPSPAKTAIQLISSDDDEDDDDGVEEHVVQRAMMAKKGRDTANWYFLSLDENKRRNKQQIHTAEGRLRTLLARSRARTRAIADASRRRASMAANRRTVATDLLKGRRQLDNEAMEVLHTDTTAIAAFPHGFMRRMRGVSKRAFHKSPVRQQHEEERHRLLERATNRIMAHYTPAIDPGRRKEEVDWTDWTCDLDDPHSAAAARLYNAFILWPDLTYFDFMYHIITS